MKHQLEMCRVLGIPVNAGTIGGIAEKILKDSVQSRGGYVCVANVHMVATARMDEGLRRIMENASFVTSDGRPLLWELRRQGFEWAEQVTGWDLTIKVLEMAEEQGVPVYFFGGSPQTVKLLEGKVLDRFPHLKVAGFEPPPMLPQHPDLDPAVAERISASGARIVFVGLGCPKQEYWMAEHTEHIPAVLLGVGAVFDFITGRVQRAPKWMQAIGLEWFFRLLSDPRRLWKRYLVTNTLFLWYWTIERLKG